MRLPALIAVLGIAMACGMAPNPTDTPAWVGTVPHALQLKKVDEGSTYMRDLAQQLPPDSRLTASMDRWQTPDGEVLTESVFRGGSKEELELALANRHPPPGNEIGYEEVDATHWEAHLLESTVQLDENAIARAAIANDPATGRELVRLDFTPAASRKFGDLTAAMVGHKLAVVVDGTIVSAPIIESAIKGGAAQITFASATEANAFVASITP